MTLTNEQALGLLAVHPGDPESGERAGREAHTYELGSFGSWPVPAAQARADISAWGGVCRLDHSLRLGWVVASLADAFQADQEAAARLAGEHYLGAAAAELGALTRMAVTPDNALEVLRLCRQLRSVLEAR